LNSSISNKEYKKIHGGRDSTRYLEVKLFDDQTQKTPKVYPKH